MKTRALVFGKFYPLHVGHERLINFARTQCDELIILTCASQKEKIPAEERVSWLQRTYSADPKITVIGMQYDESILPNSSVSSREISKVWAEYFLRSTPTVDIVVTAEDYGDYVAEYMNIRHIRYPRPKEISATAIRSDIVGHWSAINAHAQPHLVKKVVILGTESTGKSTLAAALTRQFNAELVTEAGRDLIPSSRECTMHDLQAVATEHAARITAAIKRARRLTIIDTDISTTQSYARFLFNQELPHCSALEMTNRADLYLYLDNDAPYVQDGTRLSREERDALDASHREVLRQKGVAYRTLSGTFEEKHAVASQLVSALIPSDL